jgi:hypothetical protein
MEQTDPHERWLADLTTLRNTPALTADVKDALIRLLGAGDVPTYSQPFIAAHQADVQTRFDGSWLQGKTPGEIYTLMQERMDGWTSLADAKADLRVWLPLMAAAVAWGLQRNSRAS